MSLDNTTHSVPGWCTSYTKYATNHTTSHHVDSPPDVYPTVSSSEDRLRPSNQTQSCHTTIHTRGPTFGRSKSTQHRAASAYCPPTVRQSGARSPPTLRDHHPRHPLPRRREHARHRHHHPLPRQVRRRTLIRARASWGGRAGWRRGRRTRTATSSSAARAWQCSGAATPTSESGVPSRTFTRQRTSPLKYVVARLLEVGPCRLIDPRLNPGLQRLGLALEAEIL
jgi:hypothetical protein